MSGKDFWAIGETYTGLQLREWLNKSLVYGWFRDGECLYIGQTGNGYRRLMGHDVINVVEPVLDTDEIRIIPAFELADRLDLEETLIKRHKPRYNKSKNEQFYMIEPKTKKEKETQPKLEEFFTPLPNLHKVKSVYVPSE